MRSGRRQVERAVTTKSYVAALFAPVTVLLVTVSGALAGCGAAGPGHRSTPTSAAATATTPPGRVPPGGAGLLGTVLSGAGSHLKPPLNPSSQPYTPDCRALVDPGFSGKCAAVSSPQGTVAGIVEIETAVSSRLRQERDLVWRRAGRRWSLALVHVTDVCLDGQKCGASPGLPALLWSDDIARDGKPDLVFVMPSDRAGFGTELDVVAGTGRVTLYRDLGGGFVDVAPGVGLVAYAPGASEAVPADDSFDQVLIEASGNRWRLVSDQYVPYQAAMAQHRGTFYDPEALAASPSAPL